VLEALRRLPDMGDATAVERSAVAGLRGLGGPHYLLRFCAERAMTINTATAGGNLELAAGLAG